MSATPRSTLDTHTESRSLRAVLWDMDGTLVDTEPLWMAAQVDLADRHGLRWGADEAHKTVGKPLPVTAGMLADHGVPMEVPAIISTLVESVEAAISDQTPWLPHAVRILEQLTLAGVRTGLVTMAYSPVARRVAASGPDGSLSCVVAGDDVTQGKPDPEGYLAAAQGLGVRPEDCLVVEDSPNGAESARAAGITTIVVPGVVKVPVAPGRVFVDSLSALSVERLHAIHRDQRASRCAP